MVKDDILFSSHALGARVAPNRFVAHAMEACDSDEGGVPSQRTMTRYMRLADGQWGITFVEATSVTRVPVGRVRGLILDEANLRSFEPLVQGYRERNADGLLMMQISHSGRRSYAPSGPTSVCPDPPPGLRYLSTAEIEGIRGQFVRTALLAEKLGFDGIDLKLCHGYLGNELLRPANTRNDRWGGSFENRTRFIVEAFEEIKARRQSARFVLGSRIAFSEDAPGGTGTLGPTSTEYDPAETYELVRIMDRLELGYVNVSRDIPNADSYPDQQPEEREVPTLLAERLIKMLIHDEGLSLSVIGTGYSDLGEELAAIGAKRLAAGYTDFVGIGRQSFADPHFPAKVRSGEPINRCRRCSACMELMARQHYSGCIVQDPFYRDEFRRMRRTEGKLRGGGH